MNFGKIFLFIIALPMYLTAGDFGDEFIDHFEGPFFGVIKKLGFRNFSYVDVEVVENNVDTCVRRFWIEKEDLNRFRTLEVGAKIVYSYYLESRIKCRISGYIKILGLNWVSAYPKSVWRTY